jgi:hypothetical protein
MVGIAALDPKATFAWEMSCNRRRHDFRPIHSKLAISIFVGALGAISSVLL